MVKKPVVLAIIPARFGSKRIPLKNIKHFFGKPLISYAIEQALRTAFISRVIVDTDSPHIAKIARKYGMSLADFLDYNPSMEDLNNLPIGYKLAIPCREPLKEMLP